MIIDKHISFLRLIPIIWKRIAKMTLLSALIIVPTTYFDLKQLSIGMTTPLILGTAISIFLGFRTNSAYDRWFQARGMFGGIRSQSRNLALLLARIDEKYTNINTGKVSRKAKVLMPRMIRRSIAYPWMLGHQLKDLDPFAVPNVEDFLSQEDIETLKGSPNPALALLFLQGRDFRVLQSEGQFVDGEHFEYVAIQRELTALQTQCEGLKNTPFPTHYTYFTDLFVWLLIVLLSLSLPWEEHSGYQAIPLVVLIGWIFSMIEGIGDYMDYPWQNNRNVVPTNHLSRNLEIDLRAIALGQTEDLPAPIEAVDGAMY